jgi:hypothetical protein
MSLAAACLHIQENEPPVTAVVLRTATNIDAHSNNSPVVRFDISEGDDFNDVAAWRRLVRAINSNPTIRALEIEEDFYVVEELLPPDECIEAFYTELNGNASIEKLCLSTLNFLGLPMFNLSYFLRNNPINDLALNAVEIPTPEQVTILATALQGVQLRKLGIEYLTLDTHEIQQVVSACFGLKELRMFSFSSALAALLRDPRAILRRASIEYDPEPEVRGGDFDKSTFLTNIAQGLSGNTTLKTLKLVYLDVDPDEVLDHFDNILCDSSTIEGICNSNHTLVKIKAPNLSARTKKLLKLNRNENKNKVIQKKVIQYYFTESFDMAPFANMPLPVLVELMSMDDRESNKQNAIFELLMGIPDLCNVAGRVAV